jgi:L-ascorbate metabolism protein UlaG (beta-lactamase superfamily)
MGSPEWGVDVTWHGHSCFSLTDSLGRTVVIDPFDDTVGYGHLQLRADALLITHSHFDHNNISAVKPRVASMDIVQSTGMSSVASEMTVVGIPSEHDKVQGQVNGHNRIYIFTMGGLRFGHMGDFGQEDLTPLQKSMIGSVDVLFVPVGGFTTLEAAGAKKIIDELKPALVFPMHYGNIRFYKLDPVDSFTNLFPPAQVKKMDRSTVRIRKSELPSQPLIFTLVPAERNY